ncbi:MAG TPA: hypothetical protein VGD17_01095 [Chitinophagaceae bacterium]
MIDSSLVDIQTTKRLLTGVLLAFVYSFQLYAQGTNLRLYTVNDGLTSSYFFSPYQDKPGDLWIGSTSII